MIGANIFNENRTWKDWTLATAVVLAVLFVGYIVLMPQPLERADMTAPPAVSESSTPSTTAAPPVEPAPATQN